MPGKKRKAPTEVAPEEEATTVADYTNNLTNAARSAHAELRALKKKKKSKTKKPVTEAKQKESGVVYLGHIPHGFFEDQMLGYFSQFGEVKRLCLHRSKKNGRSKGYAFIEFENPEVASIVARTMDNYILAGRVLVCHRVQKEKIHSGMFPGNGQVSRFRPMPRRLIAKNAQNAPRSLSQIKAAQKKVLKREKKKREKLKAMGIDYDFPGYSGEKVDVEETPIEAGRRGTKRTAAKKVSKEKKG